MQKFLHKPYFAIIKSASFSGGYFAGNSANACNKRYDGNYFQSAVLNDISTNYNLANTNFG